MSQIILTNDDSHELGWKVGETYKTRAYSNYPSLFDTVLGYDNGFVVVLRKQEGQPDKVVSHITRLNWANEQWSLVVDQYN